ncbi:hypothetical protein [Mycobacteroides abscessus]|uniref:TetR family transcriptional regulator n=1 Tax=Mycobacteroides abscessus subsp. abscessus TaxID=1185650 RepID=A0AB38D781_9MYCO|nr:hypothetical protein [Mycobacteroides abscessus]SIB99264.1 Uncharacterised protein [Mycobacteroides abscessus subsp. abscessus]SIC12499.1 Uncharacterised protein [Mycobacteroides abscessus subsp. abscessus]SIC22728.1 Uncharacterised protein [Mycobacteroides abscessus subsp. abscessus]SIC25560.1 Uncharacterised protein [Mycobacteroides abscessus subsp. abscessus]SIF77595.1 Uncharacterised protein [Mycobacteroides abscessus subsp. abscessus]
MSRDDCCCDAATARLHELILSARHENHGTSTDPYLTALNIWVSAVPAVREVLGTLETHESTLGEVEFVYRTAMTAWLRGTVPSSARVEEALLERIRMALDPPANSSTPLVHKRKPRRCRAGLRLRKERDDREQG